MTFKEQFARNMNNSIFLAGPCPRIIYSQDWRFEACMETIDIEISDEELNALKAAANKMDVSLNKYVEIKLQQSMQDGTFEKVAEEIKAFPGYTVEETKALIEGEREMADAHLEMLEAKEAKEKNKV